MTFTLTIELGNDAMQTCGDVARALVKIAAKLKQYPVTTMIEDTGFKIMDENGNSVGKWEVTA